MPVPAGPPLEIIHSPLARAAATAEAVGRAAAEPSAFGVDVLRRPDAGFSEIGQGEERRELPRVRRLVLDESDPARLDDYWLDMAPADVMLITRHRDKPGTVGRIGLMLGEADVNISAMHLARTRPREDAFMILALDDDVPPAVADAIRTHEAVLDVWTIRLGGEH